MERTQSASHFVDLTVSGIDLHDWSAWSVSADGKTIATAPRFGVEGVVVVDVATGAAESRAGEALVEADRPLFWRPVESAFWDESARASFSLPPPHDRGYTSLRNTGTGVLARLARIDGRLTLQVWSHQEEISWFKEIAPAPDSAGIALSPSGDLLALVQYDHDGLIRATAYGTQDGVPRWTSELPLRSTIVTMFVRQPVYFSDDGASVWVAGTRGSGEPLDYVVSELSARDGRAGRTVGVDRLTASTDKSYVSTGISRQHLWVGSVAYNPGGDGRGPARWFCDYSLYELGRSKPAFDPSGDAVRWHSVFGEPTDVDHTARALRPTKDGGVVLIQAQGRGIRITTWTGPPGARSR